MRAFRRMFTLCAAVSGIAGAGLVAAADSPPAIAKYYPLVGNWKGTGKMSEAGQAPTTLSVTLKCAKASSGSAVRCEMVARNAKMTMTESDLFGVDPVTNTGHWYAVTNQGEVHDHITTWPDAHTMKAHYAWTENGRKMDEGITIVIKGGAMEFQTITRADGKELGAFAGTLKH